MLGLFRKKEHTKKLLHHRSRPGTPPGQLKPYPEAQTTRVRLLACKPEEYVEQEIDRIEDIPGFLETWPLVWISVEGLANLDTLQRLGDLFSLHSLILEDIVHIHQRPKLEEYDNSIYIVSRLAYLKEMELDLEQISLVMNSRWVLSFQETQGTFFDPLRDRIRKKSGGRIRLSRVDYLIYALLDSIVDSFFPVLDHYNDLLDSYEDRVISEPTPEMITQIHGLKSDLMALRRAVWPQRELVNALTRETEKMSDDTRVYLRDCYDHIVQIVDILESHRERASDLINVYLSSISNKMNEVMKTLTIIATIFMPLGFVAGLYGMNFDREKSPWNMPELGWYMGYPFALGLMAVIGLSLVLYFKNKGWLDSK